MGEKNLRYAQMGSRLKEVKQYFSCNRYQISKILGISPQTYTRDEQGAQLLTTKNLMALHTKLGISLEWFLFGKGPMLWKEGTTLEEMLPPELNEMVVLMNKIPLLHHSVMLHFEELKTQHTALIRETLAPGKTEAAAQ